MLFCPVPVPVVDGGKMYGEVQEAKQKPHVDFKGCLFVYIYEIEELIIEIYLSAHPRRP